MNRDCIVSAHRAGIFSNINKVVTCKRIYDHVQVLWVEHSLYGDCWHKLFRCNDVAMRPCDTITQYPFYDITAACVGILYQNEGWGWRNIYYEAWTALGGLMPDIEEEAQAFVDEHFSGRDMIACIIRSEVHGGEQLTKRNQSLFLYESGFHEQRLPNSSLFVMSSDSSSITFLAERGLPVVFHPDTKRTKRRSDDELHLTTHQTWKDARQCVLEVLICSKARALIHPVSNMATASLYINPDQKSIYIP